MTSETSPESNFLFAYDDLIEATRSEMLLPVASTTWPTFAEISPTFDFAASKVRLSFRASFRDGAHHAFCNRRRTMGLFSGELGGLRFNGVACFAEIGGFNFTRGQGGCNARADCEPDRA